MKYQSIKNMTSQLKTLSALLILILLSGCAIPTVIKSKPEGATVYIDNIKMGKTPLTYSDTEILFSQKNIRLEMDGYNSLSSIIKKEKLKVGPLVGACFAGIPGLWALGYAEEYSFELDRGHAKPAKKESAPARAVSEDQPQKIQAQPVETKSKPNIALQNTSSSTESMVVIERTAKLRNKPSIKAAVVKNLKLGEIAQVIKHKDGWCLVELAGGETGWCARSSLAQKN